MPNLARGADSKGDDPANLWRGVSWARRLAGGNPGHVPGHGAPHSVVLYNEGAGKPFTAAPFGDGKGIVMGFAIADMNGTHACARTACRTRRLPLEARCLGRCRVRAPFLDV